MSVNEELAEKVRAELAEAEQQLEALSSPQQIVHEEFFDSWSGDIAVGNEERQNLRDRIDELQAWLKEECQIMQVRDVADEYQNALMRRDNPDIAAKAAMARIQEILGTNDGLS